jgi:hypothetical protein
VAGNDEGHKAKGAPEKSGVVGVSAFHGPSTPEIEAIIHSSSDYKQYRKNAT